MLSADALEFLWRSLPNLLVGFPQERPGGLLLSVMIALASTMMGFLIAIGIGGLGASRWVILRGITVIYINVGRGLPLLFLLLFVHQFIGGRRFDLQLEPVESAIIALTVYASAYFAEIIKIGWLTIPQNQVLSAVLLGGNRWRILRLRLRHTLHRLSPALTNQTITIFKDTSVISVLAVAELTFVGRATLSGSLQNSQYAMQLYVFVGLIYAGIALLISQLALLWAKSHLEKPYVTKLL